MSTRRNPWGREVDALTGWPVATSESASSTPRKPWQEFSARADRARQREAVQLSEAATRESEAAEIEPLRNELVREYRRETGYSDGTAAGVMDSMINGISRAIVAEGGGHAELMDRLRVQLDWQRKRPMRQGHRR